MKKNKPTIKGIFVNSHIKAVRKKKGKEGVRELERAYGKSLKFKNSEDVPVREEVKILEAALEVLSGKPIPASEKALEAGRLHFRNFTETPLAKIIFSLYRRSFKRLMMQTPNMAIHIFKGVKFFAEDIAPNSVKVIMENNDYPIDHFKGLFQEWLKFAGHKGTVEAREISPDRYEYTMTWES